MGRAVLSAPLVAWFSRLDAHFDAMDILTSARRHLNDEALAAHKAPRFVEPAVPAGVLAKLNGDEG